MCWTEIRVSVPNSEMNLGERADSPNKRVLVPTSINYIYNLSDTSLLYLGEIVTRDNPLSKRVLYDLCTKLSARKTFQVEVIK